MQVGAANAPDRHVQDDLAETRYGSVLGLDPDIALAV
jgi:hypothetical protein